MLEPLPSLIPGDSSSQARPGKKGGKPFNPVGCVLKLWVVGVLIALCLLVFVWIRSSTIDRQIAKDRADEVNIEYVEVDEAIQALFPQKNIRTKNKELYDTWIKLARSLFPSLKQNPSEQKADILGDKGTLLSFKL
jgi:hypothetical protein